MRPGIQAVAAYLRTVNFEDIIGQDRVKSFLRQLAAKWRNCVERSILEKVSSSPSVSAVSLLQLRLTGAAGQWWQVDDEPR